MGRVYERLANRTRPKVTRLRSACGPLPRTGFAVCVAYEGTTAKDRHPRTGVHWQAVFAVEDERHAIALLLITNPRLGRALFRLDNPELRIEVVQ
jgi:hypothetical protein